VFREFFPDAYYGDLTEVYKRIPDPIEHFLDNVRHCDGEVNFEIAAYIWEKFHKALDREINDYRIFDADYFVSPETERYFDAYFNRYFDIKDTDGVIGATVMNCNPFTKGHRYLVEYASRKVDRLIVFVVEENRSYFSFKDRYKMVRRGLEDIDNVMIVPSGKYIISIGTFSQYFEKDVVTEIEDMDYDIHIFGAIVSQKLGIRIRFVGEEPADAVTNRYNERMTEILPDHGVNVEIIKRKEQNGSVISATKVREAYEKNDWETIEQLCVPSTTEYLKSMKQK
jgi:[citrate (pro-3S)-lyase] ligase